MQSFYLHQHSTACSYLCILINIPLQRSLSPQKAERKQDSACFLLRVSETTLIQGDTSASCVKNDFKICMYLKYTYTLLIITLLIILVKKYKAQVNSQSSVKSAACQLVKSCHNFVDCHVSQKLLIKIFKLILSNCRILFYHIFCGSLVSSLCEKFRFFIQFPSDENCCPPQV